MRRKGQTCPGYPSMTPASDPADFEEVTPEMAAEAERAAREAKAEEAYGERVEELIRERYSTSRELAVQRQRYSKPEKFAAYDAFAEECKARARAEMSNATNTEV